MAGPTRELASFTAKITFDDLPELVVEKTKEAVLDSIGCALGSYSLDRLKTTLEFVEDLGGKPEASIIGNHQRTSVPLAAFANSELINALDYDGLGPFVAHVTPYVVSPCLAIGEYVHASGKDLITALAIAYELGGRIAASMAMHRILKEEPPYIEDSPRYGYAHTVFGGIAGACKLLSLNEDKVTNALGIAGGAMPAPGMMKWTKTSPPTSMVKYNCWPGWTAQLATVAAMLAKRGFTGDVTILDGEWGFWKIYGSPFFKSDVLTGGLGEVWHFDDLRFKPYPCCGLNSAGIEGINTIMKENEIKPEDIEQIVVKGGPFLLEPVRTASELKSPMDAQFTNAYLFAAGAYYGHRPGPIWQIPSTINDPRIKHLMKKVKVEMHPQGDEIGVKKLKEGTTQVHRTAITIVAVLARGRTFTTEVTAPKMCTGEKLKEKFRDNASYSMVGADRAKKVIDMCYGLDKIDDIAELLGLVTVGEVG